MEEGVRNTPYIKIDRNIKSTLHEACGRRLCLVIVNLFNSLEFYESIALKLAEDDYAWFPHVYSE